MLSGEADPTPRPLHLHSRGRRGQFVLQPDRWSRIPVLIGVTLLAYLLVDLAPGDPVTAMIDPATRAELGPEWVELRKEQLGLNEPVASPLPALVAGGGAGATSAIR